MGWLGKKFKEFQDAKSGRDSDGKPKYSADDLKKYTGMDQAELDKFAASTPGVAGNQNAGSLAAGPTSGLYAGNYHGYDQHKIPKK